MSETSRDYSPFCIDVRCPSFARRYLVAVPERVLNAEATDALAKLELGEVDAPTRQCVGNDFCLFSVKADAFELDLVIREPIADDRPGFTPAPGYVVASVTLQAY